RELGVAPEMILSEHEAGEAKHIFTHIEWHMRGTRLELARLPEDNNGLVWVTERELQEEYALPSAFGALRKKLFLAD
ncbi:MAG: NUDIX domain-containing protein, partial [Oscillospiraceae bacterium]|nr:NUDIX domain-containing protein [Oscillospiraceae bacterium]